MARSAARYIFAALLVLLSMQAAEFSSPPVSRADIVWNGATDRQSVRQVSATTEISLTPELIASSYGSIPSEPDPAALFQRPPPATSLFV
ncbi:MAG TPA: hypothetical protein VHZ74_23095 [Bryobacteraceae bacterium]|nr:hypothetical protein [Bryobacteraceae bacterium]